MKIDIIIIAIVAIAILGFVYFIITKNRKEQKKLENELNEREMNVHKHTPPKI